MHRTSSKRVRFALGIQKSDEIIQTDWLLGISPQNTPNQLDVGCSTPVCFHPAVYEQNQGNHLAESFHQSDDSLCKENTSPLWDPQYAWGRSTSQASDRIMIQSTWEMALHLDTFPQDPLTIDEFPSSPSDKCCILPADPMGRLPEWAREDRQTIDSSVLSTSPAERHLGTIFHLLSHSTDLP